MNDSIRSILQDYSERMNRVLLFKTLFDLERKQDKTQRSGIRYFDYGFTSLLFFYENMLIRNKKTGLDEMATFFEQLNQSQKDPLSHKEYRIIAMNIIREFRPATGARNVYPFFNWEKERTEKTDFNILKAITIKGDPTKRQYYTLDEKGLELVFATGEYYSEFQISIGQMVLRKQLEKGQFQGALKQIEEMRLNVSLLKEKIEAIRQEVAGNIVSVKVHNRYRDMVEDINLRLKYEDEEFRELEEFSRMAYKRVMTEKKTSQNESLQSEINEILSQLSLVHHEHSTLLEMGIDLKNTALIAAKETLYYNGLTSFNFKKEILSGFISAPLPLMSTKKVMNPFLPIKKEVHWSLLRIWDTQTIRKKNTPKPGEIYNDIDMEEPLMLRDQELSQSHENIAVTMLEILEGKDKILLSELLAFHKDWQRDIHFSYFIILLHNMSPVDLSQRKSEKSIFGKAFEVLSEKYRQITVKEQKSVLSTEKYTISEMEITCDEL